MTQLRSQSQLWRVRVRTPDAVLIPGTWAGALKFFQDSVSLYPSSSLSSGLVSLMPSLRLPYP